MTHLPSLAVTGITDQRFDQFEGQGFGFEFGVIESPDFTRSAIVFKKGETMAEVGRRLEAYGRFLQNPTRDHLAMLEESLTPKAFYPAGINA